jgi:hypothetical protein
MSATGADPQSESTRLRRESRIWELIRRTLPLGRSIGSLLYLISIALIAGWIIAVFFGVSFFFLMPGPANLESGVSLGSTNLNASSGEAPSLMEATSRLDRVSAEAAGSQNAANVNPLPMPAEATVAHVVEEPAGQALTVEPGTTSPAVGEAAPMLAPQSQPSIAPEPRGRSLSSRSPSSRKPLERRASNARTAQPRPPVSAIQDVLHKHSRLLK